MCVALPGKVVWVGESTGISVPGRVVYGEGKPAEVDLAMVSGVKVGDYVIVHSGYAISRVDRARAEQTLELFD